MTPLGILPLILGKSPVVFLMAALLVSYIGSAGVKMRFDQVIVAVGVFLFTWMIFSATWSVSPGRSIQFTFSYAFKFAAAIVLAQGIRAWPLRALMMVVVGAFALSLFMVGTRLSSGGTTDVTLFMGLDPNFTAQAMVLGLAISLSCALVLGVHRVRLLTAALLIAAGMVSTGSRTALLAIVVVAVVAALQAALRSRQKAAAVGMVAVATIAAYFAWEWAFQSYFVPARARDLLGDIEAGDDSERGEILAYYQFWMDEWLYWGQGMAADAWYLQSVSGKFLHVHNQFWKVAIELGLVGLSGFVVMLLRVVWNGLGKNFLAPVILTALSGQLVFFWLLGGEWPTSFWFILAMAMAVGAPGERARRASSPSEIQAYQGTLR